MVHNLCQLKRCSKIFESSVTMASKSFSGFHSAILICHYKSTELENARSQTQTNKKKKKKKNLRGDRFVELKLKRKHTLVLVGFHS
jgi:hypothetical protein